MITFYPPEATYLAWLNCAALGPDNEARELFLDPGRVGLEPGLRFGAAGSGYARLNFETSAEILDDATARMTQCASISRRLLSLDTASGMSCTPRDRPVSPASPAAAGPRCGWPPGEQSGAPCFTTRLRCPARRPDRPLERPAHHRAGPRRDRRRPAPPDPRHTTRRVPWDAAIAADQRRPGQEVTAKAA